MKKNEQSEFIKQQLKLMSNQFKGSDEDGLDEAFLIFVQRLIGVGKSSTPDPINTSMTMLLGALLFGGGIAIGVAIVLKILAFGG